jgi:hypothetical protein
MLLPLGRKLATGISPTTTDIYIYAHL